MPNQALVNYIVQQLNNSFKQEAISQHLINNGYKQQDVLEALNAANSTIVQQKSASGTSNATQQPQSLQTTTFQQSSSQKPQIPQTNILQANPQLVSYITQQRNMGFSQEQIRSYLLKYGYQQQQIEPALDSVFHPNAMNAAANSSHITHLGAIVVSIIVLVSVFSGAGIFFFFNNAGEVPELLDYRLDVAKKLFSPGETLIFEARMDKAAGDDFDVKLTHTVYDQEDNEIESIDETAEAQPRIASRMELPDNLKPGKYTLVSIGTYGEDDSQEVKASFNFEVQAKDEPSTKTDEEKKDKIETPPTTQKPSQLPDKKPAQQTTKPDTPAQPSSQAPSSQQAATPSSSNKSSDQQSSQPNAPAQPSPQPDEDGQKLNLDSIEADVRTFASDTNKISQAESLCKTLTTSRERDFCYADIVEVSKQKQFCDKIDDSYSRDVCYLNNFMGQGDYSVCDIINDYELNLACKDLAKRNPPIAQAVSQSSAASQSSGAATNSNNSSSNDIAGENTGNITTPENNSTIDNINNSSQVNTNEV
ncbi:TPA: hypothetical protein HA246_06705 [Candidatus Woesearchaeota archaeon]|nr:hypothetical protein [Candidatus Woesearchaeota archaeon]